MVPKPIPERAAGKKYASKIARRREKMNPLNFNLFPTLHYDPPGDEDILQKKNRFHGIPFSS